MRDPTLLSSTLPKAPPSAREDLRRRADLDPIQARNPGQKVESARIRVADATTEGFHPTGEFHGGPEFTGLRFGAPYSCARSSEKERDETGAHREGLTREGRKRAETAGEERVGGHGGP